MSYQVLDTHTIHDGWCRILVATIRMPDGRTMRREIEDHGAAVAVLPYDPDRGMALMVRQFRAAAFQASGESELLEVPAGLLDEDDPADCARREAREEVGLRLDHLEPVAAVWTMPGISTERMHLYLAAYKPSDRIEAGGGLPDEHEAITLVEMPLADLAGLADDGGLTDLKTFALVQALRLRRPELFSVMDGRVASEPDLRRANL